MEQLLKLSPRIKGSSTEAKHFVDRITEALVSPKNIPRFIVRIEKRAGQLKAMTKNPEASALVAELERAVSDLRTRDNLASRKL